MVLHFLKITLVSHVQSSVSSFKIYSPVSHPLTLELILPSLSYFFALLVSGEEQRVIRKLPMAGACWLTLGNICGPCTSH